MTRTSSLTRKPSKVVSLETNQVVRETLVKLGGEVKSSRIAAAAGLDVEVVRYCLGSNRFGWFERFGVGRGIRWGLTPSGKIGPPPDFGVGVVLTRMYVVFLCDLSQPNDVVVTSFHEKKDALAYVRRANAEIVAAAGPVPGRTVPLYYLVRGNT